MSAPRDAGTSPVPESGYAWVRLLAALVLSAIGNVGMWSVVLMATVFGMALGGWITGGIFDLTGSYQAAFVHGILWNLLNIGIAVTLLRRPQRPLAYLPP